MLHSLPSQSVTFVSTDGVMKFYYVGLFIKVMYYTCVFDLEKKYFHSARYCLLFVSLPRLECLGNSHKL